VKYRRFFLLAGFFFIPSGRPPFKKPRLIDAHHRYAMTKLAIKGNRFFRITDIEIKSRGPSYSIETLSMMAERHKDWDLFFILGIDAFLDFPKWKHPLRLMELAHLIIISRPGYPFARLASSPYFSKAHKKTFQEFDKGSKSRCSLRLTAGRRVFLCRITGLDIAASRIRDLVKRGKNIKYLLPEAVESYIISHKLYSRNG
jgi:nicotinate-nucleotide adenylyltransferase